METLTLYKKSGKRYVKHDDYLDERGLPCGLYLFYKPNYKGEHSAMMNMIHYAKVHDIQDAGRFSDLYVTHKDKLRDAVEKVYDTGNFSREDFVIAILAELSKI